MTFSIYFWIGLFASFSFVGSLCLVRNRMNPELARLHREQAKEFRLFHSLLLTFLLLRLILTDHGLFPHILEGSLVILAFISFAYRQRKLRKKNGR